MIQGRNGSELTWKRVLGAVADRCGGRYGTNIDYAGFVIEKITGESLGSYLTKHIFEPLGMSLTSFTQIPDSSPSRISLISLVSRKGEGWTEFKYPEKNDYEVGGGGLVSTAGDYLKFLEGVLAAARGAPGAILKRGTVDEFVLKNQLPEGLYAGTLGEAMPVVAGNEFIPGGRLGHSLAFAVRLSVSARVIAN
jgi:CubicO group peptidase (beta-lactamase class C family)